MEYNKIKLPVNKIVNIYYGLELNIKKRVNIYRVSNVILWGGGSCFNDIDGTGAVKQMILAKFVNPRIKVDYYGVGIDIKKN